MEKQKIIFNRLKEIKDYWVDTSVDSLQKDADLIWSEHEEEYKVLQALITNRKEKTAYYKILDEIISGTMHSILVMLDGGDMLTDKFNIDIIDFDTKQSLKENVSLHEAFYEYLINN